MNCINRDELELYLKGKLSIERLLAVDAHLSTCINCKTALQGLPAQKKAGTALGANLLGLQDCPEYESLSAFVEGKLDAGAAGAIAVHANFCEECAKDIDRIKELRGHASMREMVEVFPGMSRQANHSVFGYWKQAAAVLSGAVVVTTVALYMGQFWSSPNTGTNVAINRPSHEQSSSAADKELASNHEGNKPVQPQNIPDNNKTNDIKPNDNNGSIAPSTTHPGGRATEKPAQYATVLRDGGYSVVKRGGKYELAAVDGTPIRTELEARIATSIREKLRTGQIKKSESYQTATADFGLRSNDGVTIPASAPHIESPKDEKILLTNTPTFTWSESEMAESYLITVYDKDGNPVLEETTNNNKFTPSKPLPRGTVYVWRVGVRFSEDDDWAMSKARTISVLSSKDYATIQELKSQGSHLALGAAYEYFGLEDEAAAEYRALLRENPRTELSRKLTIK